MKTRKTILASALLGLFALPPGLTWATDQQQERQEIQAHEQEQIYGSQMMTEEERAAYRSQMRAATTQEERDRIRMEHHERMKERAKQLGVRLPEEPPVQGGGMGPGGGGMGPGGGGMGPGGGGMGPGGGGMGPGGRGGR